MNVGVRVLQMYLNSRFSNCKNHSSSYDLVEIFFECLSVLLWPHSSIFTDHLVALNLIGVCLNWAKFGSMPYFNRRNQLGIPILNLIRLNCGLKQNSGNPNTYSPNSRSGMSRGRCAWRRNSLNSESPLDVMITSSISDCHDCVSNFLSARTRWHSSRTLREHEIEVANAYISREYVP